ncbi:protein PIF [Patella vulgata]|uniref:protein PIF n=1 Tax=Patella vulgata TaxID=6465 RepID=UPI0024A8262A|nr:protein PIF [Patella vulgata]
MKELILVVLVAAQCSVTHAQTATCGEQRFDVIALVDGSGSIARADFQKIKNSLEMFPASLGLNGVDRRFGVAVFSSIVTVPIPLSSNVTALMSGIASLQQPKGGTNTALGLTRVIQEFEDYGIPENKQFIIVITDGRSNNMNATLAAAAQAKNMGISVFAVGVGSGPVASELAGIASDSSQVINIDNFDQLTQTIVGVIAMVCDDTDVYTDDGPCFGCILRNGIGYLRTSDCDKFLQCQLSLAYTVKQCPFGTYWDQSALTCNYIGKVNCPNDVCTAPTPPATYKTSGNCSQYYQCVNGVSHSRTCPEGQSYNAILGYCITDSDCKPEPPVPRKCHMTAILNEPCYYNWDVYGVTYKMPCPGGTAYDQSVCGCSTSVHTSCIPVCKPIVHIDFNSAEPGEYGNYGAVIQNGLAYFNGRSSIKIPRLANVDFRDRITIYTRYRAEFPSNTTQQAVVANGDCNEASTIAIVADGQSTEFTAQSVSRSPQTLTTSTSSTWKEVVYKLKSGTFSGKDGLQLDSTPFAGLLQVSQCAFQVGHGEGFNDFRGWVDYVIITLCDINLLSSTTPTAATATATTTTAATTRPKHTSQ